MDRLSRGRVTWRKAAIGIALLLPVTLAACSTGTGGSSASASSKKSKVIVLIPKQTSDPFFTNAEQGAKQAAAQLGYTIDYVGPTTADAAGQVTTIENAIRQHPAAITISGDDPNAVAPALKQAMKAGIVVLLRTTPTWPRTPASSSSARRATRRSPRRSSTPWPRRPAARGISSWSARPRRRPTRTPGSPTCASTSRRSTRTCTSPRSFPGNDDPATVLSVTSSYLSAHKSSTTGVWVIGGGMSGAVKAEQQHGIDPHQIPVAGLCIPSDVKVDINSGLIKNCVLWSPADTAYANVYAIDAAIKGKLPANGSLKAGKLRHALGHQSHRQRGQSAHLHQGQHRPVPLLTAPADHRAGPPTRSRAPRPADRATRPALPLRKLEANRWNVQSWTTHPQKVRVADVAPADEHREEDGWMNMAVQWVITRARGGAGEDRVRHYHVPARRQARHPPPSARRGGRVPGRRDAGSPASATRDVRMEPGDVVVARVGEAHGFWNTSDTERAVLHLVLRGRGEPGGGGYIYEPD